MKNVMYRCIRVMTLVVMSVIAFTVSAQTDRQYIRNGNNLYRKQDFPKAEAEYRKALTQNHTNTQAAYNLGCALLQQQKDSAAVVQFENAGKAETSRLRKAMCYHNIGVICQKNRLFAEAVEAYKESLRNNPSDNETRYNLELCKRQLKKQQQNGGGNDDKKDKEDKNKQQQKQQSDKQDNKKNDEKQKQQQQNQQQKMSKENAEQMLNAAMQEEKATQQKVKSKMQQSQSRKLQNNW